ncbi:hypothetical protein CL619_01350 [archaeon]|nr:hypothetical protein [archaeon]
MKTYQKTMTRDNGFIVQEVWSAAFDTGLEKTTGLINPHSPTLIYHIVDGANEIWEQDAAFAWVKNSLLKLNKEGPEFFNNCLNEYQEIHKKLHPFEQKGTLNLIELKEMIKHFKEASRLFVILYYTACDERTPKEIRDKALAWREHDELYDVCEKVIKQSIASIHPSAKGFELVVETKDLEEMPERETLQQRFNESIFIPTQFLETISLEGFTKRNPEYNFIIEKPNEEEKEGILRGQIASQGKNKIVQGRVRIIRRKSQVHELLDGEILVSPMTTPDFVPAMEKASAIVTDEGGITCHAAIVSREMHVSCIVGTKFATELLKSGDLVEVNTNQGTVTVLKKTE